MENNLTVEDLDRELDFVFSRKEKELSEVGLSRSDINCVIYDLKSHYGMTDINREVPNGEMVEGKYCIRISKYIEEESTWKDTLRHELAHVANHKDVGRESQMDKHGRSWKEWARVLDAEPSACKKGKPGSIVGDYMVGCPRECFEVTRHRYTKVVRVPEKYKCPECGNPLTSWNSGGERPDRYGCEAEKV